MDRIEWLRIIHVTSAVLMVGNVTVTGLWAGYLFRRHSLVPIRIVAGAIMWADLWFTLLGGTGLLVSGILLTSAHGYHAMELPWLMRGIVILAVTLLLWLFWLLPAQRRMQRAIMGDESQLRRLFLRWSVVSWISTAALFWALWGMVARR